MDYASKYHQYALQAAAAYKSYTMTEEDTTECAEFLLALKNRSVTPDPSDRGDRMEKNQHHSHAKLAQVTVPPPPRFRAPPPKKKVEQPTSCVVYESDEAIVSRSTPVLLDERGAVDAFWDSLLGGSPLVLMPDRDLVPDPLFVVMAQMKPCYLSEADRVGCYKARDLGFPGMCCKHCGGQPGFGKYFPETVRSLAQTTTSQTILKHIGSKCRFCPPHIRQAVLELQRQQVIKETTNTGRPRYGSRKVFFQRIWARLHGKALPKEDDNTPDHTPEHSEIDDDARSTDTMSTAEDISAHRKHKHRFGRLPTKKNMLLKRKLVGEPVPTIGGFEPPPKQRRMEWSN